MRLLSKTIALAAALATAQPAVAQAQPSPGQPYFRFLLGKNKPTETQQQGLRFESGDALADGSVGTPVAAYFEAAGGTPPYAMSLAEAPAGLRIGKAAGNTWAVTGTLSPAGAFRNATVTLTDSTGATARLSVPVTVTDAGTQEPLGFAQSDAVSDGVEGTDVSASYAAKGGTPPYAMELLEAPPGLVLARRDGSSWSLGGKLSPAGTYPRARVRLSDAGTGQPVSLAIPLVVTPTPQQVDELAFASSDAIPSGRVGSPVRSYYTATGGSRPYAMRLVDGPPGVVLTKVGANTWGAIGTLSTAGEYRNALVSLTDSANGPPVVFEVPVSVTPPENELAFTQVENLPPSFPTLSRQSARFKVAGGVAPYAWSLRSAPSTIFASGTGTDEGSVIGVIERPGSYSGVTLSVTDAVGASVERRLADFTVTDSGGSALVVENVQALPPQLKPGTSAYSSGIVVRGLKAPYAPTVEVIGGPPLAGASPSSNGSDPATVDAYFHTRPEDLGKTFDVALLFKDANDPARQKLVPWGTTTVTYGAFRATGQFPTPLTDIAGATTLAYARLNGGSRDVTVEVQGPAGLQAYANVVDCSQYMWGCGADTGASRDEMLVSLDLTFPKPGTYPDVQVVATDNQTGDRVYLDPITVVSNKAPPLVKLGEFPSYTELQADRGGAYLETIRGLFKGGSNNPSVSYVSARDPNLYPGQMTCSRAEYYCEQLGVPLDRKLAELSGRIMSPGTYSDIVVRVDDEGSDSSIEFAPITIKVLPPPLGSCEFKAIDALSGGSAATPGAVAFVGGTAPFSIAATGVDGLTFDTPVAMPYGGGYNVTVRAAPGTGAGTATITVRDALGDTCSGTAEVKPYTLSNGDMVGIAIDRTAIFGGYLNLSHWVLPESTSTDIYASPDINSYSGPLGVHPSPYGIHLVFVPPGGLAVTGYTLATINAPIQAPLVGYLGAGAGGEPDAGTSLYSQDLHRAGATSMPAGAYTYSYHVFLSDGTYRPSTPFTIHVP